MSILKMDSLSFNAMPAFESFGSFQVDQASIQEARDMLYAASTTDVGRGPPPPPPPDHMITGDRKRKLDDDEKKERLKAKNRKYYIKNKEGLNAYQKRYQAENKCPHDKCKSRCLECGGNEICQQQTQSKMSRMRLTLAQE